MLSLTSNMLYQIMFVFILPKHFLEYVCQNSKYFMSDAQCSKSFHVCILASSDHLLWTLSSPNTRIHYFVLETLSIVMTQSHPHQALPRTVRHKVTLVTCRWLYHARLDTKSPLLRVGIFFIFIIFIVHSIQMTCYLYSI